MKGKERGPGERERTKAKNGSQKLDKLPGKLHMYMYQLLHQCLILNKA